MLSLFPDLLAFGLFAPVIIRIALGLYWLGVGVAWCKEGNTSGKRRIEYWVASTAALAGAASVVVGLYTQAGAIVLVLLAGYLAYRMPEKRMQALLLGAMALSLVFSGAGFLAFDLPL